MSSPSKLTLVVATSNRGKLLELQSLLSALPVSVVPIADALGAPFSVVEDGSTFVENAVKKARSGALATSMLTLADDSGLEVDVLEGRPGVRSARFAHERATDAENNAALLEALEALGDGPRSSSEASRGYSARFRCAIALVDPFRQSGEPYVLEGVCEGEITTNPRGGGGFGYDPLFLVEGANGRTMAELTEGEKNERSHRGQAMAGLGALLEQIVADRSAEVERIASAALAVK